MRIMAVCHNCQRDLLLSQLVEGPRYRRNLWMGPWHENAAYLPP